MACSHEIIHYNVFLFDNKPLGDPRKQRNNLTTICNGNMLSEKSNDCIFKWVLEQTIQTTEGKYCLINGATIIYEL